MQRKTCSFRVMGRKKCDKECVVAHKTANEALYYQQIACSA